MKKLRRILVVDGSRVVHATLAKHLKDDFEIRDETNGESAWQTLVLDSSIAAVISGVHTAKLDADGLLQRLRSNPLQRLNQLPFILIASDTGSHTEQGADNTPGIAGWISKTMQKAEIVKRLRTALATPSSRSPTLLSHDEIEQRIAQALSAADSRASCVSLLTFGLVNHDALIDQFGKEVAEEIGSRFAKLLASKIGLHDAIARCAGERLLIVARGIDLEQCARFAKRVCRSVASGHITIGGQKVKLSATAGAASSLEQEVGSAKDLLALASQRLNRALSCGGNAVVTNNRPDCPLNNSGLLLPRMLAALNARGDDALAARIGTLGLQLLPLIKVMNEELSLGLQLPEIKRLLQQRAHAEMGERHD